jgi:hypothetical protein
MSFASISVSDFIIPIMLLIIGVFLSRLLNQFDELLKKFDVLNTTMLEHKADVDVIKEQISNHSKELIDINLLWDRVRIVENDVTTIKARAH